jgi:hypothetical protein
VTLGSRCMVHGLVGFLAVIGLLAVSPNASCMSARLPFFLQSQYFSEWDKAKSALVTFHSAYLVICQVYFVYFTKPSLLCLFYTSLLVSSRSILLVQLYSAFYFSESKSDKAWYTSTAEILETLQPCKQPPCLCHPSY